MLVFIMVTYSVFDYKGFEASVLNSIAECSIHVLLWK